MPSTLNLSLTDELRAFVDAKSGDGTLFATPSEFVRSVLRECKAREEAAQIRGGLVEGFQDVLAGRVVEFSGSLKQARKEAERREKRGWK
jgi:antitoxin ParD1/3/4